MEQLKRPTKTSKQIEEQKMRIFQKMRERTHALRDRAKSAEKEAATDMLTGLATRRIFDARLEELKSQKDRWHAQKKARGFDAPPFEEQEDEKKREGTFSLLFIDIDHFKQINDTYGHDAGDEVLKTVAKIIAKKMRTEDVVARYGGEEFVILADHTSEEEARVIAEHVRQRIEEATIMLPKHPNPLKITVSIGFSEYTAELPASELTRRADQALYFSKEHGRNTVASWKNPEVQEWVEEQHEQEEKVAA